MQVIKVDGNTLALLSPQLSKRIENYAKDHQPEVTPSDFVKSIMAKLWLGNPSLMVLGILDDDNASLVGHLLATVETFGSKSWIYVSQVRADKPVGNARLEAIDMVVEWAHNLKVSQVLLSSNQDAKELEKRGFKKFRAVHRCIIEPDSNS